MSENLIKARRLLTDNGYTCVAVKNEAVYFDTRRGVQPLLYWLENNDLCGYSAADKVVGKAAAYLYVLLGIKELYAVVISEPAISVLRKYGVEVSYKILTQAIVNRTGTGLCPMEQSVIDIDEPQKAVAAIRKTLELMSGKEGVL